MYADEIKKIINTKIDEIPTLPVVIPKLLQMMEDSKSDVDKISEVISNDPALTSKILKVANSAYYGFSKKISEIDRAVAILGFNMVKSLAVSLGVMKSVKRKNIKTSKLFSEESLWIHSIAVATVLKKIIKDNNFKKKEYLFITGLLHDIGKVVFDQFFDEKYIKLIEESESESTMELAKKEREIFGMDHGEIGALLLKKWKFPEEIIKTIAMHHYEDSTNPESKKDISIIRIADSLCQQFFYEENSDEILAQISEKDLDVSGLSKEYIKSLETYLETSKEKIYSFFSSIHQ